MVINQRNCQNKKIFDTLDNKKDITITTRKDGNNGNYSRSRRKHYIMFASYTILAIILIELVLINPQLSRPVEAKKKKKIIKKLKEILPLIALLKRKKIVLLPIPM